METLEFAIKFVNRMFIFYSIEDNTSTMCGWVFILFEILIILRFVDVQHHYPSAFIRNRKDWDQIN